MKRLNGTELKRGVVFISEVVPHKIVSFLANKLYKEHYSTAKMASSILVENEIKQIKYTWQSQSQMYSIDTSFFDKQDDIEPNSLEEFIYEHYYGFTKVSARETWEYKVNHPRWQTGNSRRNYLHTAFGLERPWT